MKKRKHICSFVTIKIGYSALVDLRRFYSRGVSCAKYHDDRGINIPEHGGTITNLLDEAMRQMRLMKAQEAVANAEQEAHDG